MFATPVSLLYRLRRTDEVSAWGRFVDLYTPLLYHWAQKLGEQDSDSADLVQDVFLILWRKLPEFEYDSGLSFHAWLRTIFLNRYRSRLRHRYSVNANMAGLTGVDCSVSDFSEQLAQEDDTRFLIRQAFRLIEGEFSALQQQVFRAYVLGEEPPEKVAEAMGISPGTVYGIKSKILSRLRQELHQILD
jgi:RNA polymerase sigma-70 factor (ECF subfamily)